MDLEPYGHSHSDWGGCIDDRKSTGVYIFLLLGEAISWESKIEPNGLLKLPRSRILRGAIRRYKGCP